MNNNRYLILELEGNIMNFRNTQNKVINRFSLRKLTVGLASVTLGTFFLMASGQVKAGTTDAANTGTPATSTVTNNLNDNGKATNQQTVAVTPDKPSTDKPYYDGKQVVDTPFYNNPQGTSSDLLENKNHDGKYTIYFTAKDKSGKEYTSSYATGNAGIPYVYLNSLLDKDKGAYDPDTLALHFYYENDSNDDQNINYSIKLPSYNHATKAGNTIIPDSSRKNQVSITSAKNNNYDLSKITATLDNAAASQGDWSRMDFIPVTLTVKGNDRINLSIPYKLVDTNANTKTEDYEDYNNFNILENNQRTGNLTLRTSSYKPLVDADALPVIRNNTSNNNYQYVPDLDGKFSSPETEIVQNDFLNYYFDNLINGALPVDKSTVVGDYSYTYLKLADYENYLTQHGYTIFFANGKPMDHYVYFLSKSGATKTNPDGSAVDKDGFYFEVVPVILLNQDQTYTTKTAPKAWNPSELVKTVADPTNYQVWDSISNSALRRDNSKAQLTAGNFKVTVTRNGQVVSPDKDGNYDLSQAGVYTVTYSRDFNGTVISNSGTITVNPVPENNGSSDNSGSNETTTPAEPTTEATDQTQPATNDNSTTEVEKLTPATKDDQANKNNARNDETTTETQHLTLRHHDKQTKPVTVVAKTRQSKTNNANEGTVKALADTKANNQVAHAQSLPQTGEEHGISLSIAGLIAILFGLLGFSIIDKNDKKEAN